MVAQLETDVLVVGSGPAGATSAALLGLYGVRHMLITKYGWLADTPRAHITNQRAMEVLRDLDLEDAAVAQATPQQLMANNVFCESIAGEELGRLYSWGNHPARKADYELASPTSICDLPQNLLEPILIEAAGRRGTMLRFNTEFLDLEQDDDGVTAIVKDRISGEIYRIRAKYLIGADGGRSRVAEVIGLPMEGQMGRAGSMNIIVDADLTKYVAHRPSVLYWVLQPGAQIGGIGAGLVRMVRPWNEWLIIWGYDIEQGERKLSDDEAVSIVRNLVGDETLEVKVRSTSTWTVNEMYAGRYSSGRVFCMGDAVHRHPPTNGLGSNTSIQDAYNLCWKLKYVLEGKASPSLLDSYSTERQPIGRQIVTRANKSISDFPPIFEAVGLLSSSDPAEALKNIEARKAATPEGKARRRKLYEAIANKSYEFNCHGVELNQRYASSAVVSDGTTEPAFGRDRELYYQATTWPGAHLPHVWVEQVDARSRRQRSLHFANRARRRRLEDGCRRRRSGIWRRLLRRHHRPRRMRCARHLRGLVLSERSRGRRLRIGSSRQFHRLARQECRRRRVLDARRGVRPAARPHAPVHARGRRRGSRVKGVVQPTTKRREK